MSTRELRVGRGVTCGKLMLCGEYTVVSPGAPALAVAVPGHVEVTVTPGGDRWRVTSEAMALEEADLDEVPVLAALVERMSEDHSDRWPQGAHLVVTSDIPVGSFKPGLGASAAVCAAAAGALSDMLGEEPSLQTAIEAHLDAQGGRGSGYDVATCFVGGVTSFDTEEHPVTVARVSWPEGLHAVPVFTGRGASTVALVGAVERFREEQPEAYHDHCDRMIEASRAFVEAWLEGAAADVLRAAADAQEELTCFSKRGRLGIEGGGQAQLAATLEERGVIARTAGAGGGDCVWALSDDPGRLDAALSAARAAGYVVLPVRFPEAEPGPGLRVGRPGGDGHAPWQAIADGAAAIHLEPYLDADPDESLPFGDPEDRFDADHGGDGDEG